MHDFKILPLILANRTILHIVKCDNVTLAFLRRAVHAKPKLSPPVPLKLRRPHSSAKPEALAAIWPRLEILHQIAEHISGWIGICRVNKHAILAFDRICLVDRELVAGRQKILRETPVRWPPRRTYFL